MIKKIIKKVLMLIKKIIKKVLYVRELFKRIGKNEILVLGDSHAGVFSNYGASMPSHWFRVVSVGGATISGLKNPNSVTQSMPIFKEAIDEFRGNICITLLGEVDAGFVIWYRAQNIKADARELLNKTLQNYADFIESIPLDKNVIIISAPLPTIQDGQDWGEIANLRKEVNATQLERTNLTLELNRRMESYANESGAIFINLDAVSLNDRGIVKSSLLNGNCHNHHYDTKSYLEILIPKLQIIIEQIGEGNVASRRT